MTPIIYPYRLGSSSAKDLAKLLNTKQVRSNGHYCYRPRHLIINWGASQRPNWDVMGVRILNHWNRVQISHNKLTALRRLTERNVNTVEWTQDINAARKWIEDGNIVMCRTQLTNHSGFGIVVAQKPNELVNCPLYTKYVKGSEYRIHVMKHGAEYVVFDMQQKKKRSDFEGEISPLIRSHHRGYVFTRNDLNVPEPVKVEAIKALDALQLDFGAVDLKFNKHSGKAYVLECNVAPGLENQTLKNYANEFLLLTQS